MTDLLYLIYLIFLTTLYIVGPWVLGVFLVISIGLLAHLVVRLIEKIFGRGDGNED